MADPNDATGIHLIGYLLRWLRGMTKRFPRDFLHDRRRNRRRRSRACERSSRPRASLNASL